MDVGLDAGVDDSLRVIYLVFERDFVSVTPTIHAIHRAHVGRRRHLNATMAVNAVELLLIADAVALKGLLCPLTDLDGGVVAGERITLLFQEVFVG